MQALAKEKFEQQLTDAINRQLKLIAADSELVEWVSIYRLADAPPGWSIGPISNGGRIPINHLESAAAEATAEINRRYVLGEEG